jgi:hypothetical protein
LVYDDYVYDDRGGVLYDFGLVFEGFWGVLGAPLIIHGFWAAFSPAASN